MAYTPLSDYAQIVVNDVDITTCVNSFYLKSAARESFVQGTEPYLELNLNATHTLSQNFLREIARETNSTPVNDTEHTIDFVLTKAIPEESPPPKSVYKAKLKRLTYSYHGHADTSEIVFEAMLVFGDIDYDWDF